MIGCVVVGLVEFINLVGMEFVGDEWLIID